MTGMDEFPPSRVLVVDDDPDFIADIKDLLAARYEIHGARDRRTTLAAVQSTAFDAVLLDLDLGHGDDGFELIALIHSLEPGLPVIIVTQDDRASSAMTALRKGAADYIGKKVERLELEHRLSKALEEQRLRWRNQALREEIDAFKGQMIGDSEAMRIMWEDLRQAARSPRPVLVLGETGTGKELVARALHKLCCPKAPFVAVNCGVYQGEIFATELFGSLPGIFTGAVNRPGACEYVGEGILFLDEIVEAPVPQQAALLRLIDPGVYSRIGEINKSRSFRGRIIAATNRDPEKAIASARLRADLYYRLRAFELRVPPLRERMKDIPLLVEAFTRRFASELNVEVPQYTQDQMTRLCAHNWPGNVRELQSTIENYVVSGKLKMPDVSGGDDAGILSQDLLAMSHEEAKEEMTRRFDRFYVLPILAAKRGDIQRTADHIGMTREGLRKLLLKLDLGPDA